MQGEWSCLACRFQANPSSYNQGYWSTTEESSPGVHEAVLVAQHEEEDLDLLLHVVQHGHYLLRPHPQLQHSWYRPLHHILYWKGTIISHLIIMKYSLL